TGKLFVFTNSTGTTCAARDNSNGNWIINLNTTYFIQIRGVESGQTTTTSCGTKVTNVQIQWGGTPSSKITWKNVPVDSSGNTALIPWKAGDFQCSTWPPTGTTAPSTCGGTVVTTCDTTRTSNTVVTSTSQIGANCTLPVSYGLTG